MTVKQIKEKCMKYGTERVFSCLNEFTGSDGYIANLDAFRELSKQIKHTEE
ncbi:MAG: hypothetical protein ACOCTM_04410 [Bacteroidota bacterium]